MRGDITSEYKVAPDRLRRMTIDEAAIIQTCPTDYIFSGPQSKVFSQIGNAVPCERAEAVFRAVKISLTNEVNQNHSKHEYETVTARP